MIPALKIHCCSNGRLKCSFRLFFTWKAFCGKWDWLLQLFLLQLFSGLNSSFWGLLRKLFVYLFILNCCFSFLGSVSLIHLINIKNCLFSTKHPGGMRIYSSLFDIAKHFFFLLFLFFFQKKTSNNRITIQHIHSDMPLFLFYFFVSETTIDFIENKRHL